MKIKPLLVVVLAMFMAAFSFTSPPCAGGTLQQVYLIRTCEGPTDFCNPLLWSHTFDQYCQVWCCPGDSTPVYNNCNGKTPNGCCKDRTDIGQASPQIIYEDGDRRVMCDAGTN